MTDVLRTDRLALEPWSAAATPVLGRLASTPVVVRYIADGLVWSDLKVQAVSERNLAHWREHGFGWRLARLLRTGRAVGFIGLNFAGEGVHVDPGEYEIGWWLDPAAWGQGLAREGAAAVRDEAFARLAAPSIIARIQPPNAASLAVAGAIGLQHDFDTLGRTGEPAAILRLEAERWRSLAARTAEPGEVSSADRDWPRPAQRAGQA
ncbi:MAG TPA: GNAT family N-acetyltransferase [Solirubrobacteraceae bacterium]|nr:GNAT family N-acetyltransferase [Solirubrobacteraceae bacterium]